jgi:hypothetical protein
MVYSVSFDLAGNPWAGPQVKTVHVDIPGIVQETYQFDTKGKSPRNMGWTRHSFTFRATQARSTLHFFGGGPPGNGAGPALDNVVVMAASGGGGGGGGPAQGTARLLTVNSNQDMVGPNETYSGNGKYDAIFQAQFSAPNRTVTAVEVSNTNGIRSVWDTRPNNRLWLGGVVIGGRAMNQPDGSVNFSLGSGQNTMDVFVEDNGSIRGGKTNYRMTIFFASGDPLIMDIVPANSSNTPTGTQHPLGDITKTTGTGSTGLTLDFETGRTNGWTKTGTAFNHQPTYGDNPTARRRGQPSKHVGNYWIGTFEKYQGSGSQTPGSVQGDGPIGTLTSNVFTIPTGSLSFLVGGGSSFQTRVELLVSGNKVLSVSGRNTETMHRVKWDLNPWAGQQGQIRLVDNASGGWGHINADDFRFSHSTPPQPDVKRTAIKEPPKPKQEPKPESKPELKPKAKPKPVSEDGYQSIGREAAPAPGQQGDASERPPKPPKGHSTKYGF